jgi:hypothetical protein
MSSQKDILNTIIPADDLYWDEAEGKYNALSYDEISDIITKCFDNAITEQEDIMTILDWATGVRVGSILMDKFLSGNISIDIQGGEVTFAKNIEGNY